MVVIGRHCDSAGTAQVRQVYARKFGTSFDLLTQPFEALFEGEQLELSRGVCRIRMCTGESMEWEVEEIVQGEAPSSCADEAAVSPSEAIGQPFPWREYTTQGPTPAEGSKTSPGVFVQIEACGVLRCDHFTVRDAGLSNPAAEAWMREASYRIRVSTDPERADAGTAPTFQLVPQ